MAVESVTKDSIRTARIGAILNTASGSCDETAEGKMQAIFEAAGITGTKIWCGGADLMDAAFTEAKEHELDILIVLGGDGTIRTAAMACTESGPLLIALPGGTMNVLPKALYGERAWEQALTDTLTDPIVKKVSAGQVNDERFFVAALFGAPARFAEAREAVRNNDLGTGIDKGMSALQNIFDTHVSYSFSETEKGEAENVYVICPLISGELADSEQTLEAAAIAMTDPFSLISVASAVAFGKWRDDAHVTVTKTRHIRISSKTEVPAILDGETFPIGSGAEISFVPVAFKALVPRTAPQS